MPSHWISSIDVIVMRAYLAWGLHSALHAVCFLYCRMDKVKTTVA